MSPTIEERWDGLVEAVAREFGEHPARPERLFDHDRPNLELRARRLRSAGGEEWFSARISRDELLRRDPREIAREFYAAYYACE